MSASESHLATALYPSQDSTYQITPEETMLYPKDQTLTQSAWAVYTREERKQDVGNAFPIPSLQLWDNQSAVTIELDLAERPDVFSLPLTTVTEVPDPKKSIGNIDSAKCISETPLSLTLTFTPEEPPSQSKKTLTDGDNILTLLFKKTPVSSITAGPSIESVGKQKKSTGIFGFFKKIFRRERPIRKDTEISL